MEKSRRQPLFSRDPFDRELRVAQGRLARREVRNGLLARARGAIVLLAIVFVIGVVLLIGARLSGVARSPWPFVAFGILAAFAWLAPAAWAGARDAARVQRCCDRLDAAVEGKNRIGTAYELAGLTAPTPLERAAIVDGWALLQASSGQPPVLPTSRFAATKASLVACAAFASLIAVVTLPLPIRPGVDAGPHAFAGRSALARPALAEMGPTSQEIERASRPNAAPSSKVPTHQQAPPARPAASNPAHGAARINGGVATGDFDSEAPAASDVPFAGPAGSAVDHEAGPLGPTMGTGSAAIAGTAGPGNAGRGDHPSGVNAAEPAARSVDAAPTPRSREDGSASHGARDAPGAPPPPSENAGKPDRSEDGSKGNGPPKPSDAPGEGDGTRDGDTTAKGHSSASSMKKSRGVNVSALGRRVDDLFAGTPRLGPAEQSIGPMPPQQSPSSAADGVPDAADASPAPAGPDDALPADARGAVARYFAELHRGL